MEQGVYGGYPLCPLYSLLLAAYSCFTTQSFWYSLKYLLAQLSTSINSLVISLYFEFTSTFVSPLHLQCWRAGFFLVEFQDLGLSFGSVWVLQDVPVTFNFLARFHFSVSYSASVEGTVANSMLFAPVPCNASINKSSASHFYPVGVRILWLLAAVIMNCLSLPFTYRTLCGRASLFPPSIPSLSFPLPTHSSAVPFLRLLFSERGRDCREQYAIFFFDTKRGWRAKHARLVKALSRAPRSPRAYLHSPKKRVLQATLYSVSISNSVGFTLHQKYFN